MVGWWFGGPRWFPAFILSKADHIPPPSPPSPDSCSPHIPTYLSHLETAKAMSMSDSHESPNLEDLTPEEANRIIHSHRKVRYGKWVLLSYSSLPCHHHQVFPFMIMHCPSTFRITCNLLSLSL